MNHRSLVYASILAVLVFSGTAFAQQFTDVSVEAGLHRDFTRSWGNPLWGDFNNDGKLDLLVSNHEAPSGVKEGGIYPYIYINNGDGTFTDVQETSGVVEQTPDTGAWQGISIADYDNDGNLDIFVSEPPFQGGSNATTRNLLFKGHGDGTWEYVSEAAGLPTDREYSECSFFVDYDNDGYLDIFVKNIPDTIAINMMYHNNGDGTFTTATDIGDLATANRGVDEGSIVSFADYDNDGWMDVVVGGNGSPDALYHNNRDGTFSEVTTAAGLTPGPNTQGLAWGDYDNDGLLDLYVSRPGMTEIGAGNANLLYHNNGDGTFTDVAAQEGVALEDDLITSAHKLAAWGDYNDDGYLDLAVKDGISPGLLTGDAFKGLHYLLKNNGGTNHYIKLNLQGTQSNLRGIGARVTVIHDGQIAFRQNNGGGGGEWGSQGDGPMHFGIGTSTTATVTVVWPSGLVDIVPDVSADTSLTVTEGSSPLPVRSQNISTRLDVQTGDNVGIGGFIITGTTPKSVLVRGIGPSLADSGIQTPLADPVLELHKPDQTSLIDDNWKDSQQAEIAATGLAPTNDAEAAILASLDPGPYTVVLSGKDGTTGIALVEVYDLDTGITSQLANVSTRGFVGTGDDAMIGGTIIGPNGAADATVVVRAIGPSLGSLGVTNPLADPTLELHDANGDMIAFNNNWQDDPDQAAALEADGLAPTNDLESAISITLSTGSYTAVVHGQNDATGVGLVEIYNLQ